MNRIRLKYRNKESYAEGMQTGVNTTLQCVYKALSQEFGFGDKRLNRLEDAILKEMKKLEVKGMR